MTAPTITVDEAQTLVAVTDGIGRDPVGVEKAVWCVEPKKQLSWLS